jgi:transcriptional regulator with XRE-family HTH domain
MNISQNFTALKEKKGVTLQEIASATALSYDTLANISQNRHTPTLETLNKLATYFGVTLDAFMKETKK